MNEFNKEDFIVRYPGQYDEREQAALDKWWEAANAINTRGPIDVQALVNGTLPADTPGIGPTLKVTEAMVRYNNAKYEQENPLFNDAEYARKAGYKDIPAYPIFGTHDDSYTCAFPEEARDTLLVSQASHWVESYQDIYPGDTLFLVIDERQMIDLTPPEGSVHRSVALYNGGTVYNQRGEIVNKCGFHYMESLRTFKPGKMPPGFKEMGFLSMWEAPDWMDKEDRVYTDEDYEYMKNIWKNEKIQGAEPLYWEDVNIGDEPPRTLEGPIIDCSLPSTPYGMGIGGTRTMKKEILDDEIRKTMIKDAHGILRLPNEADYTPSVPDGAKSGFMIDDGRGAALDEKMAAEGGAPDMPAPPDMPKPEMDVDTTDIHAAAGDMRAAIINFVGRDFAIHAINNWMGDKGRIFSVKWAIMPPETHAAFGHPVPESPYYVHWISQAPGMEDAHVDSHGLTRDTAEVHLVVVDKYVKNGKYLVKLIWWISDMKGTNWVNGSAEVELPHKQA
ncbi:MAG: hypothetical protein IKZ95_01165 [Lachnospiraceae bacterium]|nr:hypothetical protein [Lachnospiraceae bacterium]